MKKRSIDDIMKKEVKTDQPEVKLTPKKVNANRENIPSLIKRTRFTTDEEK